MLFVDQSNVPIQWYDSLQCGGTTMKDNKKKGGETKKYKKMMPAVKEQ
jgi:hypothetical protein